MAVVPDILGQCRKLAYFKQLAQRALSVPSIGEVAAVVLSQLLDFCRGVQMLY